MYQRLAIPLCVKIQLPQDMISTFCIFHFFEFLYIFAAKLLRPFYPKTVPFPSHSFFYSEAKTFNLKCYQVLKVFSSSTMISKMPISWKIQDFSFWPVFNASKKFQNFLQQSKLFFLDRFPVVLSEYIQFYMVIMY